MNTEARSMAANDDATQEAAETASPRRWTSDTLLRKYGGIEDPETLAAARRIFLEASAALEICFEEWADGSAGVFFKSRNGIEDGLAIVLDSSGKLICCREGAPAIFSDPPPFNGNEREADQSPQPDRAAWRNRLGIVSPDWFGARTDFALTTHGMSGALERLAHAHMLAIWKPLSNQIDDLKPNNTAPNSPEAKARRRKIRRLGWALYATSRSIVHRRAGAALRLLRERLDPDALKILNRAVWHRPDLYNFYVAADRGFDRRVALYRRQAAESYPLMAVELSRNTAMSSVVDAAGSMAKAIAENALGGSRGAVGLPARERLPDAAVRRLVGLNWQRVSYNALREPSRFLRSLADIPHDWTPENRKGFAALTFVHTQITEWFEHEGHFVGPLFASRDRYDARAAMRELGPDWTRAAALLGRSPVIGIKDMYDSLADTLLVPWLQRRAEEQGRRLRISPERIAADPGLIMAFGGGRSLKQLLRASDDWHRNLRAIDNELHSEERSFGLDWAPLTPPFTAKSGLQVVILSSERELREEGLRQNHCVGGYVEDCLEDSVIGSIRTPAGDILSTFQTVQDERDPTKLEIRQHFARQNLPPSREATAALRAWQSAIRTGRLEADWEGLEASRREAKAKMAERGLDFGPTVDWRDRNKLDRSLALQARFLPREARGPGFAAWLDRLAEERSWYGPAPASVSLSSPGHAADASTAKVLELRDGPGAVPSAVPGVPPAVPPEQGVERHAHGGGLPVAAAEAGRRMVAQLDRIAGAIRFAGGPVPEER